MCETRAEKWRTIVLASVLVEACTSMSSKILSYMRLRISGGKAIRGGASHKDPTKGRLGPKLVPLGSLVMLSSVARSVRCVSECCISPEYTAGGCRAWSSYVVGHMSPRGCPANSFSAPFRGMRIRFMDSDISRRQNSGVACLTSHSRHYSLACLPAFCRNSGRGRGSTESVLTWTNKRVWCLRPRPSRAECF